MLANLLGVYGITVDLFEAGASLIDFPRGVGMDDETLRTFQNAGLVDEVLQHTIPNQLLVFVDAKGRDLARLAPGAGDFGWPRRNGFVQPLADQVLLAGLSRFEHVRVHWSSEVTSVTQDADGVTVEISGPNGEARSHKAAYVVGADGGRSAIRKSLGLRFDGSSSADKWLVIDIRNDPLGRPGAWVYADPRRPYVSISIPHGIRRFEFMVKPGETEEQVMTDEFVRSVLDAHIPKSAPIDIIRRRVYIHHSRMAERFRSGRAFLIGDAAHLMPVWQGQGYNSGIRDSFNLAWKLAFAVRGGGGDVFLDSYDLERRDHARAMIDLSTRVGQVISVRNRAVAGARDVFFKAISIVPRVKRYIVTMKFKPMPTIDKGALTHIGSTGGAVGRLFLQPTVRTVDGSLNKLDDVIGPWFGLVVWNNDPRLIFDEATRHTLRELGVRLIWARPAVQIGDPDVSDAEITHVGDVDGTLKRWFDDREESVILVRPDRMVGGASPAFAAPDMIRAFADTIGVDGLHAVTRREDAA